MEIRAGLEPVIATVKGLCPNHLDERTICREKTPCVLSYRVIDNKNVIYAYMQKYCKNKKIIDGGQGRAVLPFVYGLWRIETECHLQIMNRKPSSFPQVDDVGAGPYQIDCWDIHLPLPPSELFAETGHEKAACHSRQAASIIQRERSRKTYPLGQQELNPIISFCLS